MLQTKDLSIFRHAFCDSLEALEAAYEAGLSRDTKILSRSPAIIVRKDLNVENLDERMNVDAEKLESFYYSQNSFLESCLFKLSSDEELAPFARLICREIWQWQVSSLCAACLIDKDFNEPRLIIEAKLKSNHILNNYRFPWFELLQKNADIHRFTVMIEEPEHLKLSSQTEPFLTRLKIRGFTHLAWRIFEKFWKFFPARLSRGTFIYIRQNETIRNVGLQFCLRGYKPVQFELPTPPDGRTSHQKALKTIELLHELLEERFLGIAPEPSIQALIEILTIKLSRQFVVYDHVYSYLRQSFNDIVQHSKQLIITNFPTGGGGLAVSHFAAQNGIVFASAQHGITREILNNPQNTIVYENVFAPYLLSLTDIGEKKASQSPFALTDSKVVTVGPVSDFWKTGYSGIWSRKKNKAPPIVYAQTHDRVGAFFNGAAFKFDYQNYLLERRFFEDVVAKIPHEILFKTYPNSKYADQDPIMDLIPKIHNVTIDMTGYDLRFLLADCRIIVSIGATSTLSWCMWSGKPVVYIDPASCGNRLSEDAKAVFKDAALYFDQRNPNFFSELRLFLEQDLDDIESLWEKSKIERNRRLSAFFGNRKMRPGREGYKWLCQEMSKLAS